MQLRADLSQSAAVQTRLANLEWMPSPASGVDRYMLDRDGAEVARCTTIVRYAPNSSFPEHTHGGGEEMYVLEGTFHDHSGAHGAGTYIRNPIGSKHAPWTAADGCVIWVKLRQMHPSDDRHVRIQTNTDPAVHSAIVERLYSNSVTGEQVTLCCVPPGSLLPLQDAHTSGGEELFIVDGEISYEGKRYGRWSWLRFPPTPQQQPLQQPRRTFRSEPGARVLHKAGHLVSKAHTDL